MDQPIGRTFEDRRQTIARIDEVSGGVFKVSGIVTVDGAGEALVDVPFPIAFTEEPDPGFGARMDDYSPLESGNYPTCSVVVQRFVSEVRYDTGSRLYTGAQLVIVTTGLEDQRMFVRWTMEGPALRNPI